MQLTINNTPATQDEKEIIEQALLRYHTYFVNKSTAKKNYSTKVVSYAAAQKRERLQAALKEQAVEVLNLIKKLTETK